MNHAWRVTVQAVCLLDNARPPTDSELIHSEFASSPENLPWRRFEAVNRNMRLKPGVQSADSLWAWEALTAVANEHPPFINAGLVRAHGSGCDSHAERRSYFAGGERGPSSPSGSCRPDTCVQECPRDGHETRA